MSFQSPGGKPFQWTSDLFVFGENKSLILRVSYTVELKKEFLMELTFVSRTEKIPHGKPKILFVSHPMEKEKYFDRVASLLLEELNCSVWQYKEEPDSDRQLYESLSEMDLVVIPVSERLLSKENSAVTKILSIAKQLSIPLLPLMMETGLEQSFEKMFGRLHFLSPSQEDIAAIPFQEKLGTWLRELFADEALEREISDAFRGSIFLSYRKKDRIKARQLMRFIHEDPQLLDISIWYDELLSPGEQYDEDIGAALAECDVFAMAVTPNLLEKPNYVHEVEYPEAVSRSKDILAVEMEATLHEAFNAMYPQIEGLVENQDRTGLFQRLRSAAWKGGQGADEISARRQYLIGRAYLDGLGVEKDQHLAVEQIREAARKGEPEAAKEIAILFREGKAVERSLTQYEQWMKQYVSMIEARYQKTGSKEDHQLLFQAAFELAQEMQREGNLSSASVYVQRLEKLIKETGTGGLRQMTELSMVQLALGDMAAEQGDTDAAYRYYLDTIRLRKQMIEEYLTEQTMPKLRRHLAVAYLKLGDLERQKGYLKSALDMYMECEKIRKAAYEQMNQGDQDEYEARRDYAVILMRLGELYQEIAVNEERQGFDSSVNEGIALTCFGESYRVREELYGELRRDNDFRDLILACSRLGKFYMICGQDDQARVYLQRALKLSDERKKQTDSIQAMRDCAASRELCSQMEVFPWNVQLLQDAADLRKEIMDRTRSYRDGSQLAETYAVIGLIYQNMEQQEMAGTWYVRSHQEVMELAELFASSSAQMEKKCFTALGKSWLRLGSLGRNEMTYACLEDAKKLFGQLCEMYPEDQELVSLRATCDSLLRQFL